MNHQVILGTAFALVAFGVGRIASSQTAPSPAAESQAESSQESSTPSPSSTKQIDAERTKIWNSPRMLRARAWVQEYSQTSAKITPEEAAQYMTELEQLTPIQMKLWLLKFDEEQEMIDQQRSAFDEARRESVARARAINEKIEHFYGRVSHGINMQAEVAQRSIVAEQQAAQEMAAQKADNRAAAATTLLYEPGYGLYSPLYGGYLGYGFRGYGGLERPLPR